MQLSHDMPFDGKTYYRIWHRHYMKEVGRVALEEPKDRETVIAVFLELRVLAGLPHHYMPSDLLALREFVVVKHPNGETTQHG